MIPKDGPATDDLESRIAAIPVWYHAIELALQADVLGCCAGNGCAAPTSTNR